MQRYNILFLTVFIFVSLTSVCATKENNNGTMIIKLVRQQTAREQFFNSDKFGLSFDWIHKKHHPKGNRTNDSIALYRFLDLEFYGKIIIGHPAQELNLAFDTTWSQSWVISEQCASFKSIGCWFHNKYDHTKSSEYKKDGRPFIANEGKYNLTGFYSYDNFTIAHSNATNQSFIEMVNVPWTFLFNKADGVLGLGKKIGDYDPFFYTLRKQNKIKGSIFSVYLNRDKQSKHGGNIMLGFVEPRHIHKTNNKSDTITYLNVDPALSYWQFNMDKILVVDDHYKLVKTLCPNGCKAITDTSSNTIYGPKEDVDFIHQQMKAWEFLMGRYFVNCETVNKLPKLHFVLNGKNFTLAGPDYVVKLSYKSVTLCMSSITSTDLHVDPDLWILGGAFLSQYYSIYDTAKQIIGFVRAA